MPITLPNLDDRRWSDLVDEGLTLTPFYAPELTDHNVSDPFRTLVELFAWITEMDLYMLNRIPDSHVRKFLALIGIFPEGPHPAQTVLQLSHSFPGEPVTLPAGLHVLGYDARDQKTPFRLLTGITVVDSELQTILYQNTSGLHDLSSRFARGFPIALFGENPAVGDTIYLGFTRPLPVGHVVSLYFVFLDMAESLQEHQRLIDELNARQMACHPPDNLLNCQRDTAEEKNRPPALRHHSVRLQWEFFNERGEWQVLKAHEIGDETRALTLNGRVLVTVPSPMRKKRMEQNIPEGYYLRCRIIRGAYDRAPKAQAILLNGVAASQAVETGAYSWELARGAKIKIPPCERTSVATRDGLACRIGQKLRLQFTFNDSGEIERVTPSSDEQVPMLRILSYQAATHREQGRLTVQAELLALGNGRPHQQVELSQKPVIPESLELYTLTGNRWRRWDLRPDILGSSRDQYHAVLDATQGLITCGDGENGLTFEEGALIFALYRGTRAEAGNLQKERIREWLDGEHNRALLSRVEEVEDVEALKRRITILQPLPATGGRAAQTVQEAAGQAVRRHQEPAMAVTLSDYETLAMETPGTKLARAKAFPCVYPPMPCIRAPGVMTVVILPFLPQDRPTPDAGLCHAVKAYLMRRRVLGTRVEVMAPQYVELTVRARVKACEGTDGEEIRQRVNTNLKRFFHPLLGGPDGAGWPFGRDVYRSEVMQVIDETPGVDYVVSLELIPEDGGPQCGNLCIGPFGLVASGDHEIEVVDSQMCRSTSLPESHRRDVTLNAK